MSKFSLISNSSINNIIYLGYIRFMNVRRDELRVENPTATAIEMTKQIGEEWNKLSDECKKPYLEAAELDKERFHKECIEYNKKVMHNIFSCKRC